MNERVSERTNKGTNERTNGRTNERTNGRTDERTNEREQANKHTSTGQGTVWENVVDTMLEFPLQQQGPPDPQTPPTPTPLWFIFLNSQTGYGSRAAFFAGMMIPGIQGMVPGLHFLQA